MRIFIAVLALAVLAFSLSPSVALDAEVSAELERLANDPTTDVPGLAKNLAVYVHETVGEICKNQRQMTQVDCIISRLLYALDRTGILLERCGALSDKKAVAACTVAGARALPIIAALGRDPREDVDWENAGDSYLRLREASQRCCAAALRFNA